jgi:hypothetical protein
MNGKMSHHRVGPQITPAAAGATLEWSRQHLRLGRVPQDARARANLTRTPQQFGDETACGLPPGSVDRRERWCRGLVESTCVRVGHGEDANQAGSSGTLPAREPDAARRDRSPQTLGASTASSN